MSDSAQFLGGGGLPIGTLLQIDTAPAFYTATGQEFLRSGYVIPYVASYAAAAAAGLGVWGLAANQPSAAPLSIQALYGYIGTNYVAFVNAVSTPQYSADLITWTPGTGAGTYPGTAGLAQNFRTNGTYGVLANQANQPLFFSSNGSSWASVGGTFTTFPVATAIGLGNNVWLAGSSMTGAAGEYAYLSATNPSGAWTVGINNNLGMTTVNGFSYGAGVHVAVGLSASATAGKLATTSTPASGFTERTSASGIIFSATESCQNPVFDGTYHWCFAVLITVYRLLRTADGINWTQVALPANNIRTPYLATDGAGRLQIMSSNTDSFQTQPAFYSTNDGGATWTVGQLYVGKGRGAYIRFTLSFANGVWVAGLLGTQAPLRLGSFSLASPDYVGLQSVAAVSYSVNGGNTGAPFNAAHVKIK